MNTKFSVLMSIYAKEKPEYARACFDSLLSQTCPADEWVIVEDGKLTEPLYSLLNTYQTRYPNLIKRVPLKQNCGLGVALREGINHCSNELIARMDTDDIARNDRFERQLAEFEKNPQLDICGSQIKEFVDSTDNVVSRRIVPTNDAAIKKFQRRRTAFNHMTVMYKKSAVLRAGNYQHAPLIEDSLLWVNMFLTGARCMNIDDYLVFARVGNDMIARRSGFSYFKKYMNGRKKIYKTGYISVLDYFFSIIASLIATSMPKPFVKILYKRLLRQS